MDQPKPWAHATKFATTLYFYAAMPLLRRFALRHKSFYLVPLVLYSQALTKHWLRTENPCVGGSGLIFIPYLNHYHLVFFGFGWLFLKKNVKIRNFYGRKQFPKIRCILVFFAETKYDQNNSNSFGFNSVGKL